MKILVANPNTSTGVTDRLVASGKLVTSPGTELIPMTAPRGVPYIATRAEAAIGGAVVLEMLAQRRNGIDAAIVAADGGVAHLARLHGGEVTVVSETERGSVFTIELPWEAPRQDVK